MEGESGEEVGGYSLVFVCQQDNSESCRRILMKFSRGVGCLTGNKPFDFGADPCHDPDPEIFLT